MQFNLGKFANFICATILCCGCENFELPSVLKGKTSASDAVNKNNIEAYIAPKVGTLEVAKIWHGSIQSLDQVTVQASDSAKIEKIHVENGQLVKKNMLMISTDVNEELKKMNDQKENLKSQRLQLQSVKLRYTHSKKVMQRKERLFKKGVIPLMDREQAQVSYLEAETSHKAKTLVIDKLKTEIAESKLKLKSLKFRAPKDGILTYLIAGSEGTQIQAGTRLAVIANPNKVGVMINVEEPYIGRIEVGQRVKIIVDALGGKTLFGKVATKSLQPSPQSSYEMQLYEVGIKISREDTKKVKLGFAASVKFVFEKRKKAISVPYSAIEQIDGKNYLQVASRRGEAPDLVQVDTGLKTDFEIEITKGLNPKKYVIVKAR
jgi:membrane fusion protein, macrolide-specific efflux system